jgi:hypothetical protein
MSERAAGDFFDRLELELRAAADRGPRRVPRPRPAFAVAVAAVAVAVVVALAVLGGEREPRVAGGAPGVPPVGTVIERGGEKHTVVATGTSGRVGRWQLETYRSTRLADPDTGEEYQPAGLRCLGVFSSDPPSGRPFGGGQCGEFPRTPGFSRVQHSVYGHGGHVASVLVFGRVPDDASKVKVVLRTKGGLWKGMKPLTGPPGQGDFYLFEIPPGIEGRVNWLDRDGNEGSRGIELLPP